VVVTPLVFKPVYLVSSLAAKLKQPSLTALMRKLIVLVNQLLKYPEFTIAI
jgi:hypothetical protein